MSTEQGQKCPQDLVAIFHASFHPTRGHVIDWSLKASSDLNLENVEFNALPSGLHLVEQDVVYFNKDGQQGVCIFRRRRTGEIGHRGFRLSSLGILLARSRRSRPWRHVRDLKYLIDGIYSRCESSGCLEPTDEQWEPARIFFEERQVRRSDLGGAGDWNGWSSELSQSEIDGNLVHPTFHLPHLLRILGPSSLTLYKHVLTRRRILIYTLPPVEAACILCQIAADICYEVQHVPVGGQQQPYGRLKGKCNEPLNVLGMVTLSDMDRLHWEGTTGRGWIACTTDAIFLERPACYDLLIDLTTSTPSKTSRPTFYVSKLVASQTPGPSSPVYRLSVTRFAWSDVRLWNELDRILHLDSDYSSHHFCCGSSSDPELKAKLVPPWTDVWRVYEDVCIICAGLWMGSWRNNSTMSYSTIDGLENWGAVRLEGDHDLSIGGGTYVRNLGMGIEGRPGQGGSDGGSGSRRIPSQAISLSSPAPAPSAMRRTSASSGKTAVGSIASGRARESSSDSALSMNGEDDEERWDMERKDRELRTTLSLLQTFYAHASFQLSVLESFLPGSRERTCADEGKTVYLSSKDLLAFELGPLSGSDAKYLEWLAQEYAGPFKVVVKRGWKELLAVLFGYT